MKLLFKFIIIRKVELPSIGNLMLNNDDHSILPSVTKSGFSLSIPLNIKAGLVGEMATLFDVR